MDPRIMAIRRGEWKQIILAASNSGMTKKTWCEQNGISTKSFYRWQKIIRDAELQGLPVGLPEADQTLPQSYGGPGSLPVTRLSPVAETAFVEIRPRPSSLHPSPKITSDTKENDPTITICVGPYQVVVSNSFSEETLSKILRVLSHA